MTMSKLTKVEEQEIEDLKEICRNFLGDNFDINIRCNDVDSLLDRLAKLAMIRYGLENERPIRRQNGNVMIISTNQKS